MRHPEIDRTRLGRIERELAGYVPAGVLLDQGGEAALAKVGGARIRHNADAVLLQVIDTADFRIEALERERGINA